MNELLRNHPRSAYDAIKDRVNFSTLKRMAESPAHYKWALENPSEPTDAMDLGTATHLAILESERFDLECVEWTGKVRNGKKWDEFEAANAHRTILTSRDMATCRALQKACAASEQARPFLTGGSAEVTMLWSRDAVPGYPMHLKGRIDYLSPLGPVDLKTCDDASPEGFARQVLNMGYLSQAALYLDGYATITGERHPFAIVAVEKTPPFVVQVYFLASDSAPIALGREHYTKWMAQVGLCRVTGEWPGYATGPMHLQLPRWAQKEAEEALYTQNLWNVSNQEQGNA